MFDYRNMFDLTGKTAVIVGGASGIGQASAVSLAAYGAKVYCADLDEARCAETIQQIEAVGGAGTAVALDMRDASMVTAVLPPPNYSYKWSTNHDNKSDF